MAGILDKVQTIVLVMMENRSFDHILGHLSFEGLHNDVDGLKQPLSQYQNLYQGDSYIPFTLKGDVPLESDVPHEFSDVEMQLAQSGVTKRYSMTGFVEAFAKASASTPNPESLPMGFFQSSQVPVSSFLARNFCVCDRFFTAIPTSTQPNRTMSFSGDTPIYNTHTRLIDISSNNIFNWLTKNGVRWRVYHDGLSFFVLYPKLWKYVLSNKFKDFEFLAKDIQTEPVSTAPQVIIVEPSYHDAPHVGSDRPNDNHAPLAIGWGEEFLRRTYEAITSNQQKWQNTVMVLYYDEHGGFYDHVAPPEIAYTTTGQDGKTFRSLGPRIPAIVASPLVTKGLASHTLFDQTSVLQLLAEKFTPGQPYSMSVNNRKTKGIKSLSAVLNNTTPWPAPAPPSDPINVQTALGQTIATAPGQGQDLRAAFENAALEMMKQQPAATAKKYPELYLWKKAVDNAR